jgi:large subunit ribosomal protein L5
MTTEKSKGQPKDLEKDTLEKELATPQDPKDRSTASRSKKGTSNKTGAKKNTRSNAKAVTKPTDDEAATKKTVRKKRVAVKAPDVAVKSEPPNEAVAEQAAQPKKPTQKKRSPRKKKTVTEVAPETIPEASVESKPQSTSLPRLHEHFRNHLAPQLMEEFAYSSTMQVPVLEKIVVNIGLGEALENSRAIENATGDLAAITGQQPVVRRARKSIASFKLREGQAIGLSVTLRGRRMYEFLDRLISSSLPRIRDFNGLSRKAFDGRGNYSIGLREQIIFPEIDYNSVDRIRGLQIVIVTTAQTDREGFRLLELIGIPFARTENDIRAA